MGLFLVALTVHIFAGVVWIGSMFFGYAALKPAVPAFNPEERMMLWRRVFSVYNSLTVGSIIVMWISSVGVLALSNQNQATISWHALILLGLVTVMTITTLGVTMGPYQSLQRHIGDRDFVAADTAVATIRKMMLGNTLFGTTVLIVATVPGLSSFDGVF